MTRLTRLRKPSMTALAAVVIAAVLTPAAYAAGTWGTDVIEDRQLEEAAAPTQRYLEGRIATAQQAAFGAATIMTVQPETTAEQFAALARIVLGDSPHITRVAYARLEGDRAPIVYEGPLGAAGLSPGVGVDLLATPLAGLALTATPRGAVTGLVEAEHAGRLVRCFVVLYPVLEITGEPRGWVFTEVDVDGLLAGVVGDDFRVTLADTATASEASIPATATATRTVDVIGTPWTLTVSRAGEAPEAAPWLPRAAAGSALAAVVAAGALLGLVGSYRSDLRRIRDEELERKVSLAQESLERSRLASIVEGHADGVITMDVRGFIRSANEAAEAMFGYAPGELAGRAVAQLMPEQYRVQHASGVRRVASTGESRLARQWLHLEGQRRDGGVFPLQLYIYPVERDGATEFAGIMRPVRPEPKPSPTTPDYGADFVAHAAHEMKSAVHSLILSLEVMGTYAQDCNPNARKMLQTASASADRMGELLQGLMDLRRVREGAGELQMATEDLSALVLDVLADEQHRADARRVQFGVRCTGECTARIDRRWFRPVLSNLVRNAVKYAPSGTDVTIELAGSREGVTVRVADLGPGIPEEFQPHVFQMFARAPGQTESGNGIGLALAREIVELHGGTIGFETAPGAGTTFQVELPAAGPRIG